MKENTKTKSTLSSVLSNKSGDSRKEWEWDENENQNQNPDGGWGPKKCQIKLSERLLTHFRGPLHKLLISW